MYRILLLSDVNSSHTQKWAFALAAKGIEIGIFSLGALHIEAYKDKQNITILSGKSFKKDVFYKSTFLKASYLKIIPALKKAIKEFNPDIVHAHYASSYGLLGALSGFHPLIISVWGSDVYDFPAENFLFRRVLKYNLGKADKILSTSHVMASETAKYTEKKVVVTPFGIDIQKFKPMPSQRPGFKYLVPVTEDDFVIGIVKMLERKYGIEYLIRAFALVKKQYPERPMKLVLIGNGTLETELKMLAKDLQIENAVHFAGYVEYEKIPAIHNIFDVEVFPSINDSESFGVSVVEASASAKPVIVSNVGGLPEVVEDKVTGIVVPPANIEKLAEAIIALMQNEKLRTEMGNKGRQRVEKLYNLEDNVNQMVEIYKETVEATTK